MGTKMEKLNYSENSRAKQETLFREYQATVQHIHHVQTLQGQLSSILLAGIFLFIGLSLTSTNVKLLLIYFPFIILISTLACLIWAIWYRHLEKIIDLVIAHRCQLEKKLGFDIETQIQRQIYSKQIPFARRLSGRWPIYFCVGLSIILSFLYLAVLIFS